MTTLYVVLSLLQSLAISLGVGCSTTAVVYYLTGKHDGPYDPSTQHYTRIITTLLRAALFLIVLSTVGTAVVFFLATGTMLLTTYTAATWVFLIVLLAHVALLKFRLIPAVIGPSLQAGTWYAFGTTVALPSSVILNLNFAQFLLFYAGFIGVVIIGINLIIAYQKGHL